jgi:hypothetical protein
MIITVYKDCGVFKLSIFEKIGVITLKNNNPYFQ